MADTNKPKSLLFFNNLKHRLEVILTMRSSVPCIDAEVENIETEFKESGYIHTMPPAPEVGSMQPMFYKFNGKLVVLVGMDAVLKAKEENRKTVRGHLVSGPMLKRARVVEEVETVEVIAPPPPVRNYDDRFANRPRVSVGYKKPRTGFTNGKRSFESAH